MEPMRLLTEDAVSLEAELRPAEGDARGTAVLCHPHPRLGGSMDHPLLWAIRGELAGRGFAVLSFNFRGVLGSGGTYGGGRTEVRDLAAALERVRAEAPGAPTVVCGWSFGANVALREALEDPRVAALALVGLPLGESGLDLPDLPSDPELRAFKRPVPLVSGQGDQYSTRPDLEAVVRLIPRAELEIVPGTDHFFWRKEHVVAERVASFAERLLA
jgi:alpha/beta superfamily hydrolase